MFYLNLPKIILFSCDKSHLPSGIFFPYHDNSRYSEIAHIQVSATEPLKKRLWQNIIQQKILNQAEVLVLCKKNNSNTLKEIAKRVQSGDPDNREGYAAQIYWNSLFDNFIRRDDTCIINKALNYGYAIVRGCVARNIVASGLLPCFGIHHDNQLNQFNLVDDIMEPLRPMIDIIVANMFFEKHTDLTPEIKNKLASVLISNCNINGEEVSVLKAIEMLTASLAKAFIHKDYNLLKIPSMSWNITTESDGE